MKIQQLISIFLAFNVIIMITACNKEDPQEIVNKINNGLPSELKNASNLRFKSDNINDWIEAKKIYESYLSKNPNDVIANYRFCEFHRLVNPLVGQTYCEKAVKIIESNQDSRFSSDTAKDLYLSDASETACEVSLYNKYFDKAIMYCQKSLNTNFTKSDPILMKSSEVMISHAQRKDNSVIVLSKKPICESDPSSTICN